MSQDLRNSCSGTVGSYAHETPRTRGETFLIPLKYIDVTRTTFSSLDVLLEKNIEDYWNLDGQKELSDAWTGFTRFTVLDEKQPDGYTWSRERLTRKQTTSRPDTLLPEIWKDVSDSSKKQRKAKAGYRKTEA